MRFPLEPLMVAAGVGSMKELRQTFPMNGYEYRRVLDQGLSERQADHWAVKLGLHPAEVWQQWVPDFRGTSVEHQEAFISPGQSDVSDGASRNPDTRGTVAA